MAWQFQINLIREDLARRRLMAVRRQVLAVSMLLFGVMMLATLSAYLHRNQQAATLIRTLEVRARTMLGEDALTAKTLDTLAQENAALESRLERAAQVLEGTTSWPVALLALATSAREADVSIRRAESVQRNGRPYLTVEGLCTPEHPAKIVREFLRVAAKKPQFADGAVISMRRDEREGNVVFEAQLLLDREGGIVEMPPSEALEQAQEGGSLGEEATPGPEDEPL